MMASIPVKIAFGVLFLAPLTTVGVLAHRLSTYAAIIERYECKRSVCEADFDGDGQPGSLSIDRVAPVPNFDSWWVVSDSNRELLRVPRRSLDNTIRTHVAIVSDSPPARLLVYDNIADFRPARHAVFVYDGKSLINVSPTEADLQILAAMGANDDTGTRQHWIFFTYVVIPAIGVYCIALSIIGWKLFRRRRTNSEVGRIPPASKNGTTAHI